MQLMFTGLKYSHTVSSFQVWLVWW